MAFKPGESGNPSGRPKVPKELVAICRDISPEVVQFWVTTMRNAEEKAADRLRASENIMERAYGKAAQNINANVNDQRTIDTSTLTEQQRTVLAELALTTIADDATDD